MPIRANVEENYIGEWLNKKQNNCVSRNRNPANYFVKDVSLPDASGGLKRGSNGP